MLLDKVPCHPRMLGHAIHDWTPSVTLCGSYVVGGRWRRTSSRMLRTPGPWPFGRKHQECMWSKLCWLDGRQAVPEDDYGPEWYTVAELEQGTFEDTGSVFDVRRLEGSVRDRLWEQYGPP